MNDHETKREQNNDMDLMGMGGQGVADKAKDPKKAFKRLINYLAPQKVALTIVIIFAVVSTVFAIVGPRLLGRVTTILVEGMVAHWMGAALFIDFRRMANIMIILIALYVASSICHLCQEIIMARLSVKVTYELREKISAKMHRLPISYYDIRTQGEVLSRMTNDVDMISQTLSTNLTMLITSSTTLVGVLIMMISISISMTAAALVVIPLSMWIMVVVLNKSHVFFSKQQEALGKLKNP